MKCERISDDFLSAQEYASGGDRKSKFNNIRDEEDGEIVSDMMIELQSCSPAGKARNWWKMGVWWEHVWEQKEVCE